ncbi:MULTISPECIES: phosphatidylserine decarboxylase [unclassified Helicobacter]|uniref:phosphatidylserine decarboxylase n=1 Tax=unclassified Helicobacter TaxID=2593540 RepID=UPI000CF076D3|nr:MULTISPECIES: phosphatidylserine decarboxylase [unclassified Helicobacter]
MTNKTSRIFGKIASCAFPSFIQRIINKFYVRIFKIDLSEFEDIGKYKTLNALFTRSLKKPRDFNQDSSIMIAPTDSLITEMGDVVEGRALQIKGKSYSVKELLGQDIGEGYQFVNFYLSPSDYHHYHSPCDLDITEVRYFAGKLLPVNMPSLRKNENLFITNERVVVVAKDKNHHDFFFVAVGALNVGKMSLCFEERIQTNAVANQKCSFAYDQAIRVKKGEEMGMFEMGSTVVVFAKGLKTSLQVNQKVKFGDDMGIF